MGKDQLLATTPAPQSLRSDVLRGYAIILKATSFAGVIGLLLIALSILLNPYSSMLSEIVLEAGKVVVVTSVVGLIFEFVMHEQFVARVRQQVEPVGDQVQRLDKSIETLQKTVAITSGAIESGLSAVYSDRKDAIADLELLLENANAGESCSFLEYPWEISCARTGTCTAELEKH